jgi:nitroreductase/NAD-dependent dihydropyrimidine dehydrogenase PreA subunit
MINGETCIGCGRCVETCPTSFLTLQAGKAVATGEKCLACGQCEAACPKACVVVSDLEEGVGDYTTFQINQEWVPYGKPDLAALVSLMRSRRSCRHFLDTPVDLARLQDLARIGASAPSGTNCQAWTFTILPDRAAVLKLSAEILRFFVRLNKVARNPLFRFFSRDLRTYYCKHYASIDKALKEWEETKKDKLFFNAPAIILVGCKPGASTPAEDALLATQNILLAAHAMGLGTCLIGFATAALKRDRSIQQRLGIPKDETIYAVIALGLTDDAYCRVTRRKLATTRVSHSTMTHPSCKSSF